jgi:hypothetical protein
MKDAPDEGFRPGRTGSSLLWDEGNRRDGDQPARLDARDRRRVRQWLGGSDWCYEDPDVDHDDHACERFASSLAWAYWPRPRHNIMAVHTAVTAAEFREMLPRLLGPDDESIASQGLPRRRSSPTLRQVS